MTGSNQHQELRDFVERCDHTSIGMYRVELDRLIEQLETQSAQIEALLRVVGDYEQRLGIPAFMRWQPNQPSNPAKRPT